MRKHEIRYHNRVKRDYVGGEPTYKQVERLQKLQSDDMSKWTQEQVVSVAPAPAPAPTLLPHAAPPPPPYMDTKEYMSNHQIYFSEVTGLLPHQTSLGESFKSLSGLCF